MIPVRIRSLIAVALLAATPESALAASLPDQAKVDRAIVDALRPARHPRLFINGEDLAVGRTNATTTTWGRDYLASQRRQTERFVSMEAAALRALVPPPGSQFVYGLGLDLDPVRKRKMRWAGWEDPFRVRALDGTLYPNAAFPDTGEGYRPAGTTERFYFRALANGGIVQALEQRVLPALADVFALGGSTAHARTAAVLLDAIAATYPTNRRGPLDYPTATGDLDRGGRLDRPYYQVARGLANYAWVIDVVAGSGELEQPSAYGAFPIREHVARNLLWDGGAYCHDFATRGYQLHNGHADYLRGAALAAVMLGLRELASTAIAGPLSFEAMLEVNIDRNGFYYETSPSYAAHNRTLYVDLAEIFVAMRRLGWNGVPDAYAHANLGRYLEAPFNRQEVGGHVPQIGDAGPDKAIVDPAARAPTAGARDTDSYLGAQLAAAWIQLIRTPEPGATRAAELLTDSFATAMSPLQPPASRWHLFHVTPQALRRVASVAPQPGRLQLDPIVHGAKGLALLRGGEGTQRYGAQLYFGPGHNHSQRESLTWTFFARGAEWSYDPGYFNKHYRMSWTSQSVAHLALVVDGRSHPWENGAARLVAWQPASEVQWVLASHPDLYADRGVTQFDRFLAQVHNRTTGEAAYWLDVGRVAGGKLRDDSFHSQMVTIESAPPLPPPDPARPSLAGDRDLGTAVLASDHLAGYDAANFYLVAPGDGYGFLGSPREIPLEGPVRVVLRDPLFAQARRDLRLTVDYVGAPGRRLLVAEGGAPFGVKRVPYLLQQDSGSGRSVFQKVLRLTAPGETDPIREVTTVPVSAAPKVPEASGLLVHWHDGRRDLWLLGGETGAVLTGAGAALPIVHTNGIVTLVQFDAAGAPRRILSSGATRVAVQGGPEVTSPGNLRGRVTAVAEAGAELRIAWEGGHRPPKGAMLVTVPPWGASAVWEVADASDDRVRLADATLSLARTEMLPVSGRPGYFAFAAGISRFYSGGSRPNTRYASGKAVYAGATFVGRVRHIEERTQQVLLEGPGVTRLSTTTPVRILETAVGDTVVVPLNLEWRAPP
ncbi:MAG: heparinase II/III family protein [Verrucomicrobia bacterium]|nr:heparinase II/III family protein [Verrucomicrobiota bacterium]